MLSVATLCYSLAMKIHKLVLVAAPVVLLIGVVAWAVVQMQKQISPAEAEIACETAYQDSKKIVAAVPNYTIESSGKDCKVVEDELGADDYILTSYFSLTKDPISALAQADVAGLAKTLPTTPAIWDISTQAPENGQPESACAYTSRYLDNTGDYIDQGYTQNRVKYNANLTEPGYVSPCAKA
jgi:hypothetical protein